MKRNVKILAYLVTAMLVVFSCSKDRKIQLFNGKDLGNWDKVVFDTTADPDEVIIVEDGIIRISGEPFGYLLTKDSYENYRLHVEWCWPEEPSNSGVFLHVQELSPLEFPLCIEAQLKHESAGDLVLIGHGAGVSTPDTTYIIHPGEVRFKRVDRLAETSENPAGEWNTYEITCQGNNIELIVNGVLQNAVSEATLSSGQIALQSEGGPIEFRNVYLKSLK